MQKLLLNKLIFLILIVAITACEAENNILPALEKGACRMIKTDQGDGVVSELGYDSEGYLIKEKKVYKAINETHLYEEMYLYNGDRKIIKKEVYKNGDLEEYTTYEYNSSGLLSSSSNYRDLGKIVDVKTYTYDSEGRIKEVIIRDSREVYSYDNYGNVMSVDSYYGDQLISRLRYENYDDKLTPYSALKGKPGFGPEEVSKNNPGRVIMENINISGTNSSVYTYSYEYNNSGYATRVTLTHESGGKAYDIFYTYQCN